MVNSKTLGEDILAELRFWPKIYHSIHYLLTDNTLG
jgi:hypothetical protein